MHLSEDLPTCIGTTPAYLNWLENLALYMLRLKICVSAGAIIGAASFRNLELNWSRILLITIALLTLVRNLNSTCDYMDSS